MTGDQVLQFFDHRTAAHLCPVAMDHGRQGVHRLIIDEDRHFHEVVLPVADHLVIKAGIALGDRLQPVVEIEYHLVERQVIDHHRPAAGIGQVLLDAAAVLAELQHIAEVIVRHEDRRLDARLFHVVDVGQVRHVGGVVQFAHLSVLHVDVIDDRRRGGDQFDIVFAFDPVADHLKVQQAEETAAEAEAKRGRCFHLVGKARVVEREFFDGVAQVFELGAVHRKEAAEHHRLRGFETRQRGLRGALFVGDGVADAGVAHLLDRRVEVADLSRSERLHGGHRGAVDADIVHVIGATGLDHANTVALFQGAVDDPHDTDHA